MAYDSFRMFWKIHSETLSCVWSTLAQGRCDPFGFRIFPIWPGVMTSFLDYTSFWHCLGSQIPNSGFSLFFFCSSFLLFAPVIFGLFNADEHLDRNFSIIFFVNGLHWIAEKWHLYLCEQEKSIRFCSMLLHMPAHCPAPTPKSVGTEKSVYYFVFFFCHQFLCDIFSLRLAMHSALIFVSKEEQSSFRMKNIILNKKFGHKEQQWLLKIKKRRKKPHFVLRTDKEEPLFSQK